MYNIIFLILKNIIDQIIYIIKINNKIFLQNTELNSEVRKLQRTLYDINTWECDICRRWRINKRDQACQTIFNNTPQLFTMNNEIIEVNKNIK